MSDARPIKIAIIGGGCASIAAAFELSRPEHHGKYQITIYQLGWRLGGKGASGRGAAARIEEHGFHVWMGYYENSFRLLRQCYEELERDPSKCRIANWRDAFFPAPFIALAEKQKNGSYWSFLSYFPPGDGAPGDPITEHEPFSISYYLKRAIGILRTMLLAVQSRRSRVSVNDSVAGLGVRRYQGSTPHSVYGNFESGDLLDRISTLLKLSWIATIAGLVEATGILLIAFESRSEVSTSMIVRVLEMIASSIRHQTEVLLDDDPELLILWQSIDLVTTAALGILRFGLISDPKGFDAINDYDFREWLQINGATDRLLNSALVRGTYDLMFAYEDGDYRRPRYAAGVTLRCVFRMLFSSRGSIFWKMRAGMGDVVFAPYYEVLKRRGVSFKFFHRLKKVNLSAPHSTDSTGSKEEPYVESLEFDVQAKIRKKEYQPLVEIDGLSCWPSDPDYDQLVDGDYLKNDKRMFESHWDDRKVATKTLHVIKDFDLVVLGVGLGAISDVCQDLIRRSSRWQEMVNHLKTVATQTFQIWMREDMESLGWKGPPCSLSAFTQPFETWADMSHLLGEERWQLNPLAIAYFCSVLRDPVVDCDVSEKNYPAARHEEVRRNAVSFLNKQITELWPNASGREGEFNWALLTDPGDPEQRKDGEKSFDSQYWRANINPSDRYVLSLPGTDKFRISPLDDFFSNLSIAGDWTACGLDAGCVEAATISGQLAAHAISGFPALESIIGYDHP